MNKIKSKIKPSQKRLSNLKKASAEVLFQCQSVFPFTLFPNQVVIDKNKVDLVYGKFFFSKDVISIMLEDIRTVEVATGPFFASLKIDIVGYEINLRPVRFLTKSCALEARKLVVGLAKAKREKIELLRLEKSNVRSETKKIGKTNASNLRGV